MIDSTQRMWKGNSDVWLYKRYEKQMLHKWELILNQRSDESAMRTLCREPIGPGGMLYHNDGCL